MSCGTGTNILRNLFLTLLIFLTGEMACRVWDGYEGWKKYNRFLIGKTTVQRDQIYSIRKPRGVKRIVLLGGSAAYDTADDFRGSWPHKLERFLKNSYPGIQDVEVINFGFYSETSTNEWEKLARLGWKLAPDLVIVFDGFNDVYNLWHDYEGWKKEYEITQEDLLYGKHRPLWKRTFYDFRRSLKENSALYQRLNQFFKFIKRKLSLRALSHKREANLENQEAKEGNGEMFHPDLKPTEAAQQGKSPVRSFFENPDLWPAIKKDYLEIYGSNLERIAKIITEKTKARGLYIFQPDLSYKPVISSSVSEKERGEYLAIIGNSGKSWRKIISEVYPEGIRLMEKVALNAGFEFFDFNQKILTQGDVADLFTGNVHFAGQGKETMAREIGKIILDKRLLDARPKGANKAPQP